MRQWVQKNSEALRWLCIAALGKLLLFVFFTIQLNYNRPANRIINHIFYEASDTHAYYQPIESFVNGNGYDSICRMPALLPVYGPCYFIFGAFWGKTIIILLQFLIGVLSVYTLALIALKLFKSQLAFKITFWLYLASSLVSIWDNYGLSDSFGISTLIFSVYFAIRYTETKKIKLLLLAGLFAAWTVFFRQVHLVALPFIALLFFDRTIIGQWATKQVVIFSLPFVLSLGLWSFYTYQRTGKFIVLVGGQSECFRGLPEEVISVRKLITAWGGDIQPWSKGSSGEWFFTRGERDGANNPFEQSVFSSGVTIDSLILLKKEYNLMGAINNKQKKDSVMFFFNLKVDRYHRAYMSEHPMRYYVFNRIKQLARFMFPSRVDDLPFPRLAEMGLYHKFIKVGYLLLLYFVSAFSIVGAVLLFFSRSLFPLIPLSMIGTLTFILGYTEQRYLAAPYPFLVILAVYAMMKLVSRRRKKQNLQGI